MPGHARWLDGRSVSHAKLCRPTRRTNIGLIGLFSFLFIQRNQSINQSINKSTNQSINHPNSVHPVHPPWTGNLVDGQIHDAFAKVVNPQKQKSEQTKKTLKFVGCIIDMWNVTDRHTRVDYIWMIRMMLMRHLSWKWSLKWGSKDSILIRFSWGSRLKMLNPAQAKSLTREWKNSYLQNVVDSASW